jgi:hypothetical protein
VAWSGTANTVTSDIISAWGAEGTNPTLIANATYENSPANLNLTTSYATYSVSAAVDTASTKNIIVFIWSDVTDTTAGDFLFITDVQLEVGSVATPFERIDYGRQLIQCQRYFEKSFDQTVAPVQNVGGIQGAITTSGVSTSINTLLGYATFAAEKRATPTITTFNPFAAGSGWSQGGLLDLAAGVYGVGTRAVSIRVNGTPTLTNTNQAIHWTASAEL